MEFQEVLSQIEMYGLLDISRELYGEIWEQRWVLIQLIIHNHMGRQNQ